MTTMPEDAQKSEDGNWWWDDSNQQWQAVEGSDASQHVDEQQGDAQQQQPQVDWGQLPDLQQLLAAQGPEDWLGAASIDPQILHGDHAGESMQQLEYEFYTLRDITHGGDPAQADLKQLVQQLMQGSGGVSLIEILKQLVQQLREGDDSNADQLEQLTERLEREIEQLQYYL